ncbi:MAG: T9SS type A sorting domain-containing protein [Bacteroidetes bacterium]|nr:T9SS type A sorting domain-containing protein [Bacteroidota bacterium]
MKSFYTLIALTFLGLSSSFAQTITTSGFSYSPDSLVVHVGDQVTFNCDFSMHPLHEVDSATWVANGSTQLTGGFSATSGNMLTVPMTQIGTRYYVCSVHVSAGMKGRIFVTSPNGIEAITAVSATIYPNPASGQLHIITGSETDLHYSLLDMMGRTVLSVDDHVNAQGYLTLDVSDLADGPYVLHALSADGTSSTAHVQVVH